MSDSEVNSRRVLRYKITNSSQTIGVKKKI